MSTADDAQRSAQSAPRSTIQATARRLLGPFAWVLDLLAFVPFLGLRTLFRFDAEVAAMTTANQAMAWWSRQFGLRVTVSGLRHVPTYGPVMLYGNHPTGLGDGIALFDALKDVRPDLRLAFLMNAQGLQGTPAIADAAVQVSLRGGARTGDKRALWRDLERAVADNRALVLFPSGQLSRPKHPWGNSLVEPEWRAGVVSIPQRFPHMALVPFQIRARNRRLYYWLSALVPPLKNVLLYIEFHAKRGAHYDIAFLAQPPTHFTTPAAARAYVVGGAKRQGAGAGAAAVSAGKIT